MLSRIKEERLPVIAAPVDSRAFSDELNSARRHVLDLISRHLTEFGDKFPAETCQNGFYPLTDNVEWTTSFWTGQLWLAWEMSGEEKFRAMAEKHVRSFGLRIAGRNDTNTHDLGFLYTLSCVAAWRLTGNREARGFSLLAAEALLERGMKLDGYLAWAAKQDVLLDTQAQEILDRLAEQQAQVNSVPEQNGPVLGGMSQ